MDADSDDGWYLLQTNYDPGTDDLFIDDRTTPGNKCMKKLGQRNVGFKVISNVAICPKLTVLGHLQCAVVAHKFEQTYDLHRFDVHRQ